MFQISSNIAKLFKFTSWESHAESDNLSIISLTHNNTSLSLWWRLCSSMICKWHDDQSSSIDINLTFNFSSRHTIESSSHTCRWQDCGLSTAWFSSWASRHLKSKSHNQCFFALDTVRRSRLWFISISTFTPDSSYPENLRPGHTHLKRQ